LQKNKDQTSALNATYFTRKERFCWGI